MKKIIYGSLAIVLATPLLVGCDDAVNKPLSNSIYLAEALNRDDYDCIIKPMNEAIYNVTVKMTHKVDHDVKITMMVDRDMLKRHLEEYGENLPMLPDAYWSISDSHGNIASGDFIDLTIPANQTTAVLNVKISNIENPEESQYALPIVIHSVSEDIMLLNNQTHELFVFQAPFETSALFYNTTTMALAKELPNFPVTRNWTIEFHYHIDRTVDKGTIYGCPMMTFSPSEIYIRQYLQGGMDIHILGTFGPGSYNIVNRGYASDYFTNRAYQGEWNHFALVCENGTITSYLDGQLMTVTSSEQFNTDFAEARVSIGSSVQTSLMAYSEIRFWSVARTPGQLNRFKYSVDPDSKGLELYYKLNDCDDKVIKDWSHNGYDIDISEVSQDITWGTVKTNANYTSFSTVKGVN